MKRTLFILLFALYFVESVAQSVDLSGTANAFLNQLSADVKSQIQFKLDDEERFNWHYVPRFRNGVSFHDLTQPQMDAALNLLKASLSVQGYKKATDVMTLENVLREVENRSADDTYRDPKKYFFSIFGTPAKDQPWGWRLEGHHISLNFAAVNNKMESSTRLSLDPTLRRFHRGKEKESKFSKMNRLRDLRL